MFSKLTRQDSSFWLFQKRGRLHLALLTLLFGSLCLSLFATSSAAQADPFASPFFKRTWNRADYPVAIGATKRSFTWGPDPFYNTFEPYVESPNGQRQVEYFDKSRMEITRPDFTTSSDYYVTNGLIVKEMVMGLEQTGDYAFAQRLPAFDVPVAGDPGNVNPDAATYASFYALNVFYHTTDNLLFGPVLDRQPDRTNERAAETINKIGAVGRNDLLGSLPGVNYVYYERTLGHNIPGVFWDFLNQSGPIWNGNSIVNGKVFDWVSTMGYPITDAFWTKTNVAGVPRDVLVQLYERRVLTYTPTNPDPYKVEMGNVGRHYYSWRYDAKYDISLPQQSNAEVKPEAAFPGTTIAIRVFRFVQGEPISTTIVTPDGKPFAGSIITPDANPTGFTFYPVYFQTNANTKPGQYTIYFKGTVSGNEAKAYFFIIGIPGFNLFPS
ncbi:MAG TPA: hypothetical protein VH186_31485 [Chloroflexia bacterium]|nr:hypothetical protein [Chloroflexia bacterium]